MCAEKMNAEGEYKMKILAVEDEENVRNLYATVMSEEGHRVVTASNGTEAIEKIKKERFDLVILDLKMPDMHGTEVLKRIRDEVDNVSVIIVTAYPSLESSMDAIKAGVYDYIIKPFGPKDLRMVVQRAVEKVKLEREKKELLKELENANKELKERVGQLEKFTKITSDREEKMSELKKRIKELEEKLKSKGD